MMAPHYQIVVERPGAMDELSVLCDPAGGGVDRAGLAWRVREAIFQQLWLTVRVEVSRSGRAAQRGQGGAGSRPPPRLAGPLSGACRGASGRPTSPSASSAAAARGQVCLEVAAVAAAERK